MYWQFFETPVAIQEFIKTWSIKRKWVINIQFIPTNQVLKINPYLFIYWLPAKRSL